ARGQDFEDRPSAIAGRPTASNHPEVTFAMLCRWMLPTRERVGEPGARPRHRHIEGWFRHDGAVARWSGAFLRRWLPGGQPGALPGPDGLIKFASQRGGS